MRFVGQLRTTILGRHSLPALFTREGASFVAHYMLVSRWRDCSYSLGFLHVLQVASAAKVDFLHMVEGHAVPATEQQEAQYENDIPAGTPAEDGEVNPGDGVGSRH